MKILFFISFIQIIFCINISIKCTKNELTCKSFFNTIKDNYTELDFTYISDYNIGNNNILLDLYSDNTFINTNSFIYIKTSLTLSITEDIMTYYSSITILGFINCIFIYI